MSQPRDPRRSSIAVGGDEHKKRGLLPLLLGLLALAILAIIIGLVSCGGDDDKTASTSTPSAATPSTSTPSASAPTTSTPSAAAAPSTDGGTLVVGTQSLLGDGVASIGDQVAKDATGTGLKVLSLSTNGFFVGTSDADRQYVEFGGKVGEDEANSARPKVGTTVDLKGPVRPAPEDPEKSLKLSADDAAFVKQQGAYVNADSVTPAAG